MLQKKRRKIQTLKHSRALVTCCSHLHRALAGASKVQFVAFADAALVRAVSFAFGRKQFIRWIRPLFARAIAQHFQVNDQTLIDADWIDLECLLPIAWIRWTRRDNDFRRKANHIAWLQSITFVRCSWCAAAQARRMIGDFHGAGGIVFHFNGRCDFLQINSHNDFDRNIRGVEMFKVRHLRCTAARSIRPHWRNLPTTPHWTNLQRVQPVFRRRRFAVRSPRK